MSSSQVLVGFMWLNLEFTQWRFLDRFRLFFIVCSSISRFWLLLWYLQFVLLLLLIQNEGNMFVEKTQIVLFIIVLFITPLLDFI